MTAQSKQDCSRCTRGKGETFWCYRERYIFDVDLAREFVADGRELYELDSDDVLYCIDRCEINEGHLLHVDPTWPGLWCIYFPDDGQLVHGHRLIDGHHRAARCAQLGIPFRVYVLTESESVQILTRAPEGARPEHLLRTAVGCTESKLLATG